METPLTTVLLHEIMGTGTLLLLGCGVVANVALAKSKGEGGGFFLVSFGWGLAVFAGVFVGWRSGAHKKRFDESVDPDAKPGVFATGPAIRNPRWNVVTEVIGTFVLVYVILQFGNTPTELGPLAVALLVVGIGASLGGPTGYAINPARDLGPRLAYAVLPIPGKRSSDWSCSWIPIVGPLIGGALAGVTAAAGRGREGEHVDKDVRTDDAHPPEHSYVDKDIPG